MKRIALLVLVILVGWMIVKPMFAQTQHGILWTHDLITTDTAGNTITVTGYNFYSSTSPNGVFNKVNSSPVPGSTFLQTGLSVGTTYYVKWSAVSGSLEGGQAPVSAGVLFQFPPATAITAAGGVVQ